MSYQPLVYAQTSTSCIRVDNHPTGCCTSVSKKREICYLVFKEFDKTFPIGLQGLMTYEEWLHHLGQVNVLLHVNQRKMRMALLFLSVIVIAFAITLMSTTVSGDIGAIRVVPWVFMTAIILAVFWVVKVTRGTEHSVRGLLESFNREFVPRGIQWRLHVHNHHKKRIFYVSRIYKPK
jgi:uncharacterized membrane protein (DUF485 family)